MTLSKQLNNWATGTKKLNTIDNCTTGVDESIWEDLRGLVNDQFRPWYFKQFYRLGRKEVMRRAAIAKADGITSAPKLFSKLLKEG